MFPSRSVEIVKDFLNRHPSLKASFDQRIRFDIILTRIGRVTGKNCLDLGCGAGILGKMIEKRGGKVIYLSPDSGDLEHIKNGIKVVGDGTKLPFRDKVLDYVVSSDVLEHIPDYKRQAFIDEMIRVAKEKVVFTFSQVHSKNPRKSGINIFERTYNFLKVPWPDWYNEHNKLHIPQLNEIKETISKQDCSYHVKPYQGYLGLFFLGLVGAWASLMSRASRKNRYLSLVTYFINRVCDYLSYAVLRFIDIKPYYSFPIEVNISRIGKMRQSNLYAK